MVRTPLPRTEHSVVIVDDHTLFAEALELALRSEGFGATAIEPASDSVVASELLALRPDVLLVDLDLGPWGDGFSLIEPAARAGIGVVVLTGIDEADQWARAVLSGASKVLSKAEPLTAVLATVRDLIQGHPVMSPEERADLLAAWGRRREGQEAMWARFDLLTMRESEVLGMLMQGQAVREIARHGNTAEATVRTQVKAVLGKLEVSSQLAAVGLAYRVGWRSPFDRPGEG